MNCRYCQGKCVKNGKQANGTQRYLCKHCGKTQQAHYQYAGCNLKTRSLFLKCLKIGSRLRGIQYVTGVAVSTQLRWIRAIGKSLKPPSTIYFNDEYELDELCTYVGNKSRRRWVISSLSRATGKIIEVKVGTRTLKNLKVVVDKLLSLSTWAIFTDKLNIYASLIPQSIHQLKHRGINRIERYHLNLRTHLERLNRRTICFSKSEQVLGQLVKTLYLDQEILTSWWIQKKLPIASVIVDNKTSGYVSVKTSAKDIADAIDKTKSAKFPNN